MTRYELAVASHAWSKRDRVQTSYIAKEGASAGVATYSGEVVKVSPCDEHRYPTSPFESLSVRFDNDQSKRSAGGTRVSPWEVALAPFQMFNGSGGGSNNNNNNNNNNNSNNSMPLPTPDVVGSSFLPPASSVLFSPARREACLATIRALITDKRYSAFVTRPANYMTAYHATVPLPIGMKRIKDR